ncbi:MAG: lytic transglycosylase domain-containing protein [Ferruginibacter sp.]
MKHNLKPFFYFFSGIITASVLFFIFGFEESKKNTIGDSDSFLNPVWKVPAIPDSITFAGENVPLERVEIREYFDRNLTQIYYQTGTMLNLMKLSKRWFPIIEERLKQNGVPSDFKYLCVAESNLQNLISKAGAVGFWQFMPATAPSYDLQLTDKVDERYNVLKSTDAASRYLLEAYKQFGSWTSAAASYNCGKGGFNAQATFQQTKDYYGLHLPEETNNYIFRILSFKHLFENADSLGYSMENKNFYLPYQTRKMVISSSINDLARFAIDNGTSYKVLKIINPWLRGRSLVVSKGKTYEILLPAK